MRRIVLLGAAILVIGAAVAVGFAIGHRSQRAALPPRVSPTAAHHRRTPSPGVSPSASASASAGPTLPPAVTTSGSELTKASGAVKTYGSGVPCTALEDPGFTARCGSVLMSGGRATWVAEYKIVSGLATPSWFVHIDAYTPAAGGWVEVLRAADPSSVRWTQVQVVTADLTGDGTPELIVSFRYQGSGAAFGYDILAWPAGGALAVAAHPDVAAEGAVRISGGLITAYAAQFPGGAPACCPPYFLRYEIGWRSGAFRVMSQAKVKPSTVPSSQL